jgi:hypothetical protein
VDRRLVISSHSLEAALAPLHHHRKHTASTSATVPATTRPPTARRTTRFSAPPHAVGGPFTSNCPSQLTPRPLPWRCFSSPFRVCSVYRPAPATAATSAACCTTPSPRFSSLCTHATTTPIAPPVHSISVAVPVRLRLRPLTAAQDVASRSPQFDCRAITIAVGTILDLNRHSNVCAGFCTLCVAGRCVVLLPPRPVGLGYRTTPPRAIDFGGSSLGLA